MSVMLFANCTHLATKSNPNTFTANEILRIDSLFADFSGQRPGAAVLIAKKDKTLFSKGYGLIDVNTAEKITSNTPFYLASASKQFTAMAILQLIAAEKLDQDTTLGNIFPDFPAYGRQITIQHLLTHQSGLPEINTQQGKPLTDHDRLQQLYTQKALEFVPGTKCSYSNTGYSVLAAVVAKVAKIPFDVYMQQEVFGPIGMKNTMYYANSNKQYKGYHILKDTIVQAPGPRDATMGSGSVYTSINDYFQWHLALSSTKLLSKPLLDQSFTAQKGTKNRWGHYGYGWYVIQNDAYTYVEHGGVSQSAGFICFTAHIPKEQLTVAVFTNRAWTKANAASQNIGKTIKMLLHMATKGKFPKPE